MYRSPSELPRRRPLLAPGLLEPKASWRYGLFDLGLLLELELDRFELLTELELGLPEMAWRGTFSRRLLGDLGLFTELELGLFGIVWRLRLSRRLLGDLGLLVVFELDLLGTSWREKVSRCGLADCGGVG